MSSDRLPAPSRRAYEFLKNLNFNEIPTQENGAGYTAGTIRLTGLKSFWEATFRRLALAATPERHDEIYESIARSSRDIEQCLQSQDVCVEDLTTETQTIRGWMAFFAERENFEDYISALRLARRLFDAAMSPGGRFRPPAFVHFRPTSGLYRLRGYSNGTRILLPPAMIAFSAQDFAALVKAVFTGGSKQPVLAALASDECQTIQAELDALGGLVEQTAGLYRDLAAAYERVRQGYFDGALPRPRLTWSRSFTGRKFGHYDHVRDLVMISASLDRADVPEFVLDLVMYHELLHKKLGLDWRGGQRCVHTPQFREEERRFARFAEAEAVLRRLAAP